MAEKPTTTIKNRADLRMVVQEQISEIVSENPGVVLEAMGKDVESVRKFFEAQGFIVAEAAGDPAAAVLDAHRSGIELGQIPYGFGLRQREGMAHMGRKFTDPRSGKERITYIGERELQPLLDEWMGALMGAAYVHPASGRTARDIAIEINEKTRAPNTPMTVEEGTSGGVLVPEIVAAEIFEETTERFVLQNLVRVFTSATPLRIPRRTSLITVSRQAPGGDIGEKDPNILGFATLSPEQVGAIAYLQPRLIQAASVGPVRYIVGQFAEAMSRDHQRTIIAGLKGNREPRGINTLPTSGQPVEEMANTATWVDTSNTTRRLSMRQFMYSLTQQHRMSPAFRLVMNSDAIAMLSGLNDLNQIVFRDAEGTNPERYLNKSIVETTALATVSNATTIIGGDLDQYAWLEAPGGLQVEQTTVGGQAWESNTVGVKVLQEVDGAPVIPPAFSIMGSVDV